MRARAALGLIALSLVAALVQPLPALAAGQPAAGGLVWALPAAGELKGLEPAGKPEQAEGEDLFRLINGGAGLFLEHGFQRIVTQDYKDAAKLRYSLEVYEFKTEAGAGKLFELKGGKKVAKPIGEASTLEGYYGLFRQGRYYFTVTASRTEGTLAPSIEAIARAVVARITARPGPRP